MIRQKKISKQNKKQQHDNTEQEKTRIKKLFLEHKHSACALDIETKRMNGEVAVVGISRLANGRADYEHLFAGKNLSRSSLKRALAGTKLLITFNGTKHDLVFLKKQFGDFLPKRAKHIDLCKVAKLSGYNYSLKGLERVFGIKRPHGLKASPVALWQAWENTREEYFLKKIIEYNYHDTVNLWEIGERLLEGWTKQELSAQIKCHFMLDACAS